jgi:hypothetical protein
MTHGNGYGISGEVRVGIACAEPVNGMSPVSNSQAITISA